VTVVRGVAARGMYTLGMQRAMRKATVVEDAALRRVKVVFPADLTIEQALKVGFMLGGLSIARPELRVISQDLLGEMRVSHEFS